jgi:hypothetical protein
MDEDATLTGGCNCGQVRYTLSAPPLAVVACHCTSCRKQSGATFSVNLVVRASTMAVEGELARWMDPDTESGEPLAREYCGTCGSPIRSAPSATPKFVVVKAGTLDSPDGFAPAMHIWTASKLAWVTIPEGLPQFAKGAPG